MIAQFLRFRSRNRAFDHSNGLIELLLNRTQIDRHLTGATASNKDGETVKLSECDHPRALALLEYPPRPNA
jgi:hypothetical protein